MDETAGRRPDAVGLAGAVRGSRRAVSLVAERLDAASWRRGWLLEAKHRPASIALRSKAGPTGTDITVSTLLSSRTKEGRIDFTMNGELTQMDLDKAREVVGMLQGAIEAAVSDELVYKFLTQKIGLEPERASAALIDFRELRQGSRDIVYPS
jgi:hypothetical protein